MVHKLFTARRTEIVPRKRRSVAEVNCRHNAPIMLHIQMTFIQICQSRLFTHTWQGGASSIISDNTCFNV